MGQKYKVYLLKKVQGIDKNFPISPILSPCVTRKKGRGREKSTKEGNPPPFFPSSLSPTPFDPCYEGYNMWAVL